MTSLKDNTGKDNLASKIDGFYGLTTAVPSILKFSGPEFETVFLEFITRASIKNSTAKSYHNTCSEFLDFCMYCLNVRSVADIQFSHIQDYLARNRVLDDMAYRRSDFFIIRLLLEQFKEQGLITDIPLPAELNTIGVKRKFENTSVRERFVKQEHHRVYDRFDKVLKTVETVGVKGTRNIALITLLTLLDIPIGKILAIKFGDLQQFENGDVVLIIEGIRHYDLTPRVLNALKKYFRNSKPTCSSEYIFQSVTKSNKLTGRKLTTNDAGQILRDFCKEQGIQAATPRQLTKARLYISEVEATDKINYF